MRLFNPDVQKMLKKKDVPGLIKALGNNDLDVRWRAAAALGEIGDARAVEPLIVALRDPHGWVCKEAIVALGKIGDPRAVEPLIATVRLPHTQGIFNYTLGHVMYHIIPIERDVVAALEEIGTPAVEPLIAAVADGRLSVSVAARALARIGDPLGCHLLGTELLNGNSNVVIAAIDYLVQIGGPEAAKSLITALRHSPHLHVREMTTKALGEIGDPCGVEALIEALRDEELKVRVSAAKALGAIGDQHAIDPLIASLCDPHEDAEVRACAEGLGDRW